MHKTNVNTEVLDTQADILASAATLTEVVRQQSHDIENQVVDAKILIEAIFESLDSISGQSPAVMHRLNMINCFATCALRNMVLVAEANNNVLEAMIRGAA